MNILILGDVMGRYQEEKRFQNLPEMIANQKIDFVVINGENSADEGKGNYKKNFKDLFLIGADVSNNW